MRSSIVRTLSSRLAGRNLTIRCHVYYRGSLEEVGLGMVKMVGCGVKMGSHVHSGLGPGGMQEVETVLDCRKL